MATYNFPQNNRFSQTNEGDVRGNIQMSYGIDIVSEPGKIKNAPILTSLFNEDDDADFNTILQGIARSGRFSAGADTGMWRAITQGKIFASGTADPTTWTEDTNTNVPTMTNRSDIIAFGASETQNFLVSGDSTGTIWYVAGNQAASGGSWVDWWIGVKGQSALNTTTYTPMCVAFSKLFIVDYQKRVFYVPNDVNGTPATSGNGTLDISYSGGHRILTFEATSSRLWFGTYKTNGGGGMIEWDTSNNSATANRYFDLPAPVISVSIWNDSPLAITATGEVYAFNGTRFYKYAQFPLPVDFKPYIVPSTSFLTPDAFTLMHPRGWFVLDDRPHFVINNRANNATALTGSKQGNWKMPSGVWCLDPDMGLFCRYAIDYDAALGNSVGSQSVAQVGAAINVDNPTVRFIASARFYTDSSGTDKLSMFSEDLSRTYATRSRFSLTPLRTMNKQVWETAEALHKKLGNSNDRIILKYRYHESENLPDYADVTWSSTTAFTSTTASLANAAVGDEVYVIIGDGAGCSAHISTISESGGTYTVTLDDTILGVAASETGTVRVDNWKKLATISAQNVDYHEFSFPSTEASRRLELLVELRAAAGSTVEIDQLQITSQDV